MTEEKAALLIVDVQKDFCPGGALPAPGGDRIVPALNRHLAEARDREMLVYASRDWHPPVTSHFKQYGGEWPPHCVQGTGGAQFHPDLKLPADAIIVSKGDDPAKPGTRPTFNLPFFGGRMGFSATGVEAMELLDHFGNTTQLRFRNLQRNPKVDAAEFRFEPPPGADVLGEK